MIKAVLTAVLFVGGAMLFEFGVRAVRNRKSVLGMTFDESQRILVKPFLIYWMLFNFLSGPSLMASAIFLWTDIWVTVALTAVPVVLFVVSRFLPMPRPVHLR